MRSRDFESRIGLGFGLAVAISILISLASLFTLKNVIDANQLVLQQYAQHVIDAESLRLVFEEKVAKSRAYLFSGDPVFLDEMRERHGFFQQRVEELRRSDSKAVQDPGFLRRLEEQERRHQVAVDSVVRLSREGRPRREILRALAAQVRPAREALVRTLEEFRALEQETLKRGKEDAQRASMRAVILISGLGIAALILGLTLSVLVARTLTEFSRNVKERSRLLGNLREALQVRDSFIGIASHELKTPLTSMVLQNQMLLRALKRGDGGFLTGERLKRTLENYSRQLARLSQLVEDMLDMSRISQGRLILKPAIVDLGNLVTELLERHSEQLADADCAVNLRAESGVSGSWDAFRIEQVVANLLTNAMKYGRGRPIEIEVRREGNRGQLRVTDHGIGIAPQDHQRIFDRFERAVSSSEISGLGLGLFIVNHILKAHQGSVRVLSEAGKGATFIVELPLTEAQERIASEPQQASA